MDVGLRCWWIKWGVFNHHSYFVCQKIKKPSRLISVVKQLLPPPPHTNTDHPIYFYFNVVIRTYFSMNKVSLTTKWRPFMEIIVLFHVTLSVETMENNFSLKLYKQEKENAGKSYIKGISSKWLLFFSFIEISSRRLLLPRSFVVWETAEMTQVLVRNVSWNGTREKLIRIPIKSDQLSLRSLLVGVSMCCVCVCVCV